MKQYLVFFLVMGFACGLASCKKNDVRNVVMPDPSLSDTATTLKSAASLPIGIAIEYDLFKSNASYKNIVLREAGKVTFGYQMKHGAIVQNDGSFDYSRADELFSLAKSAGLDVFGHTLVWHQNQNGNYLRSLTMGSAGTSGDALLTGNFEAGSGSAGSGSSLFTGWDLLVGGSATGSFAAVAGNNSSRALEAAVSNPGSNAWDVQAIGSGWPATVGKQYIVYIDIKASVSGGKVRLVNQNSQYQQTDIVPTTSWATYTWTLTALETSPIFRLNFPTAGVYTIDNIKIFEAASGTPLTAPQMATAVDTAMSRFIRSTVTRYAGKIKAWDVVNEAISDGTGAVRTHTGTTTGDVFYWSQYLGREYALKAFEYAKAADPSALLFINDYNLESDHVKLDSLMAFVAELKAGGAKIDGIGTQMHMSINTSKAGIDNMFRKLASTSLKVRVSELDVRINPNNTPDFSPSPAALDNQASLYKYVIDSYFKNVPAAQRYDLTIWGVADSDSWIVTTQNKIDFPLLFDANYGKKPAYTSVLQALKTNK